MRLWIQSSATRSGAAVIAPPIPSAPPSSRARRTCFLNAIRASFSGVWPGPAMRTHSAAWGPKRSAAASAMYSGARSGSARTRFHTRWGGRSICWISAVSGTAPRVASPHGNRHRSNVRAGHPEPGCQRRPPAAGRAPNARVLDGDRDGDELHRELDQPGRRARAGDHRVARGGHRGGARTRPPVRAAHQGALRRGAGLTRLPGGAVLPPAARGANRHRPRHQGRDRGRDRRDRALQPDHRVLRRARPGDAGHGDRHPPRRGGPPPPLRGLPARVQGRGPGLAAARIGCWRGVRRRHYAVRVQICSFCGGELPKRFRFCGFCGSPLETGTFVKEARKTVTVVFCDLKGSTNLGEALDSESLRELMSRYFERMSAILESHGGTVEKFIGDAIMAVFGLREVHEDDALRAVRAAAEMKLALSDMSAELARRWGVTLENRTGVNTGEVVAGEPIRGQRLVIGDAVNVAARLEQAAPANEILMGELTYRLVEDAVDVVPMEPLDLKGKAEPVAAFRLLSVSASEAHRRRHERPMVGRRAELEHLCSELGRARAEGAPRLVTVLGQPGVGKSTLLAALEASVADEAQIVRGRCLSYGRGITFWPLLEIIREAAAISEDDSTEMARQKLLRLAEDEAVAETLASAIGLSEKQFAVEETFWAARRLLERLAAERPLIVVLEDLHSAELTFLNLVVSVLRSGEAPILLVSLARHELLDIRGDWLALPRASGLLLEPLSGDEIGEVIDGILGSGEMAGMVRERILEAAGGNPLFVEQMLSMMIDDGVLHQDGDGRWSAIAGLRDVELPPSIHALLAARLDRLKSEERSVLEPASVVGFEFARDAIEELVDVELTAQVGVRLSSLVARELIHPEVMSLADEGYRFDHLLVRDAAYGALLKRERAVLHERFAVWAERTYGERHREAQLEEVLGYHLEQAVIYLQELGPLDAHGQRLRSEAAERLSSAGHRALARGDMTAAANLLRRAATLLPAEDPVRIALLPDLGEALTEAGEFVVAQVILDEGVDCATATENLPLLARAELMRLLLKAHSSPPEEWSGQLERDAGQIVEVLEGAGDHAGLAAASRLLSLAYAAAGRCGESADVAARAIEYATLAGDERQRRSAACHYAQVATYGPTPVEEAIAKCEEILSHTEGDMRTQGIVTGLLGRLEAMTGNFERARWLYNAGRAVLEEMGQTVAAASTSLDSCAVEMLAGDPEAAERELRRDYAALDEMGEKVLLSTIVGELARAVYLRGDHDQAEQLSRTAEELAAEEDVVSQALWRTVRARVLARRGEDGPARRLAHEAVELLKPTGELVLQAEALLDLAAVLELSADGAAARRPLSDALALFERKGDVVSAASTRDRISRLEAGPLVQR